MNLMQLIRTRLNEGTDYQAILSEVQANSPKPQNWRLSHIIHIHNVMRGTITERRTHQSTTTIETSNGTFDFDPRAKFGIELELTSPMNMTQLAAKLTRNGVETVDESYNHDTRHHWKLTTDGSVNSHKSGYMPMELVSPILKGYEALEQIKKVCAVLENIGCEVNASCGYHVHHDCVNQDGVKDFKVGAYAVAIYKKWQYKFSSMLPRSRRNGHYCKPSSSSEVESAVRYNAPARNRYRAVNLQSYARHGTVEFRQHSGTVNADKIINWIKITQAVVTKAKNVLAENKDILSYDFGRFTNSLNLNNDLVTYVNERIQYFAAA